MTTRDAWYEIENVEEIPSPALVVYPPRVEENLRRIIAMAGGVRRLRPHVKTHKMAEVVRMQLAAGITKFKCATIAEAEMVARAGATDVLVAYPQIGPNARRLLHLVEAFPGTSFSTIADDAGAIRALAQVFAKANRSIELLLDIDNGQHRSGVAPGKEAVERYRLFATLEGVRPGGLHVYDGHIRDADLTERIAHVEAEFAPVDALRRELERARLPVPRVVAGGTPTFPAHALHEDRECSPGTCVFWDTGYSTKFADLDFLHAALVLTRVVSRPGGNRLCLDLGYKAVSPDNPAPRVQLLDPSDAVAVVHNEEHLAVETHRAGDFSVGDALYGIPYHICPTCALHREAVVVENGRAVGRWAVAARDRKITV
ncbi:MAG TPA: D-TA family PLP-dependent enzyme [Pirellulales bacterium]|nr:D-TA family PLP-dependent enzyme [Pirellulales bacterium]